MVALERALADLITQKPICCVTYVAVNLTRGLSPAPPCTLLLEGAGGGGSVRWEVVAIVLGDRW